jgi:hypothetical protein
MPMTVHFGDSEPGGTESEEELITLKPAAPRPASMRSNFRETQNAVSNL